MADPQIRPVTTADHPAVEAVMQEALDDAGAYFPEVREDGDPSLSEDYYEPPDGALLVAELDDRIVGTGGFRRPGGSMAERHGPFPSGVAELKRMHVRPDAQRQGIATALLQTLSQRARERDYDTFVLTTTALQERAHTFYEGLGFERFDRAAVDIGDRSIELYYYRGPIPTSRSDF